MLRHKSSSWFVPTRTQQSGGLGTQQWSALASHPTEPSHLIRCFKRVGQTWIIGAMIQSSDTMIQYAVRLEPWFYRNSTHQTCTVSNGFSHHSWGDEKSPSPQSCRHLLGALACCMQRLLRVNWWLADGQFMVNWCRLMVNWCLTDGQIVVAIQSIDG